MKTWICRCGTLAVLAVLLAASSGRAATGMVEMLNQTAARQAALGETPVLYEPDPFNLEYNPAAIVGLTRGRVGFSHHRSIQDRTTSSVAAIFPVKGVDCGIQARLTGLDDIEGRGDIPTTDPEYLFSARDFALKFSAAMSLRPGLRAGVSAGWMMEKIDIYRASAAVFGAGLVYSWKYGLIAHAAVANLGRDFTFIKDKQSLPSSWRGGLGWHRDRLSATADFVSVKSGESHLHLGGEYLLQQYLFLRAGYQTGYDSRSFSAGAGFLYDKFRIDYAFVPYTSDLGNSHRFSLVILFQ